jgi:hypothetical protein
MTLFEEMHNFADKYGTDVTYAFRDNLVHTEITDHNRWSVSNRDVFHRDGEYVAVEYETAATEYQDDDEFEVVVYPVIPREVVAVVYDKVTA